MNKTLQGSTAERCNEVPMLEYIPKTFCWRCFDVLQDGDYFQSQTCRSCSDDMTGEFDALCDEIENDT